MSQTGGRKQTAGRFSRRRWLAAFTGAALTTAFQTRGQMPARAAAKDTGGAPESKAPLFRTRGVVISPSDFTSWPWPRKAKEAGLTTIATHVAPSYAETFVQSDSGRAFLDECRQLGIEVEFEQHALGDLLPRNLFEKNPNLFRMDEKGQRVPDANLCVHSKAAVEIVCGNAVKFAQSLRPTTGRYFYWVDDGMAMCRCPECKGFSDSDQALLIENAMLAALRNTDPRATLAHLCYHNTLTPPTQIKPDPGIFLEFAPIERRSDQPISRHDLAEHVKLLDYLEANLAVFGREGAQVLEYWLDVSRFSGWKRDNVQKIAWDVTVFRDDLAAYAQRGIRHVTTFACWLDGNYVTRYGEPPLAEYGQGLLHAGPAGLPA